MNVSGVPRACLEIRVIRENNESDGGRGRLKNGTGREFIGDRTFFVFVKEKGS